MIQAVLFDLGGTLHVSETTIQRKLWFAERLLNRLGDYGIRLDVTPVAFAQQLPANTEAYKHSVEGTLRELPGVEIWDDWFLRDYHIRRKRLAPIAEELCFLYDYEHARILRRPHLGGMIPTLYGTFSLIVHTSVVKHFPFASKSGTASMMQIAVELEEAADINGASFWQRMRRIVLPLAEMLRGFGFVPDVSREDLKARVDCGWTVYGRYRDATEVELKPIAIWCDYVLKSFDFPTEALAPHCEELAHMWELTHYRRALRPKVKEMLTGLQSMGLKLGIISNTAALYQVFVSLEAYGIRDFFQDVTLSSVTGMRKPAPDIFRVALRQLRSEPRECVYVGDTVSRDVIGAKRAGFAAAIQTRSHLTKEKDRGVSQEFAPDYVIEDIYQVYPLLQGVV